MAGASASAFSTAQAGCSMALLKSAAMHLPGSATCLTSAIAAVGQGVSPTFCSGGSHHPASAGAVCSCCANEAAMLISARPQASAESLDSPQLATAAARATASRQLSSVCTRQ